MPGKSSKTYILPWSGVEKRDDGLESVNIYLSNNKYHGISVTKLSPGVLVNVPTWMQPLVHEHIDAQEYDIVVATRLVAIPPATNQQQLAGFGRLAG